MKLRDQGKSLIDTHKRLLKGPLAPSFQTHLHSFTCVDRSRINADTTCGTIFSRKMSFGHIFLGLVLKVKCFRC